MQEKHLFEYAIIRVVPRVEREEFFNVGVIVYCAAQKFLQVKIELNRDKLAAFTDTLDIDELQKSLWIFEQICLGTPEGGAIAKLPPDSRFRWLTATRSTIVQTSAVHPGLCEGGQKVLERLYDEMVR